MSADCFEIIETSPAIDVREDEYKRLLGLPPEYELSGRTLELARWARDWYAAHGRPWIYLRRAASLEHDDTRVIIDGISFHAEGLRSILTNGHADDVFLLAVSAGKECEAYARTLWHKERPDEYFFLEIFGSAVTEHLVTSASLQLCTWADPQGLVVLPHISPGYTGWNIGDQPALMALIERGARTDLPGDLGALPTGMLSPKKSLLGIIGIARKDSQEAYSPDLVACRRCSLAGCVFRRAPQTHFLPGMEQVPGQTQGSRSAEQPTPLFTLRETVLEKWATERLSIRRDQDGDIHASFRYSGTTCTNMGIPLEFNYLVSLSPRTDGYRILDARCIPAPEDIGHRAMCGYRDSGGALMNDVSTEKPLVGRPLNDIFGWKRPFSPAGCFCNETSRMHKWGIILEVIAYALTQDGE